MKESKYAEECLPRLLQGAKIERIPRGASKTPDLMVTFEGATFLIEEKERIDNDTFIAQRKEILERGEIHNYAVPRVANNTLDGIIRDAIKQIASQAAPSHDYALVWVTATGRKAEAVFEQLIATIYGKIGIIGLHLERLVTCYFFTNSSFFRGSQSLDGVIAAHASTDRISFKLCINPLSSRYASFKASEFVSTFKKFGAVDDPLEHEREGKAFLLDSDIDRADEAALLAYLESKYSVSHIQTMALSHLSAELRLPASTIESEDLGRSPATDQGSS